MRRAAVIAAALLAPAAAASGASGATLTTDHDCYLVRQRALPDGQAIVATADGFTPGAGVTFSLPTGPVAVVPADATGRAVATFASPSLPNRQYRASRALTATDGSQLATASLQLRALAATFAPTTTSNAVRQRVRFFVYGFGPVLTAYDRPTSATVYMHVFQPPVRRRGKLQPAVRRGTFNVGRTSGPCGDLRTSWRKILPFGVKNGTWAYRFTTSRRYRARDLPQAQALFEVCTVFVLPGTKPPPC